MFSNKEKLLVGLGAILFLTIVVEIEILITMSNQSNKLFLDSVSLADSKKEKAITRSIKCPQGFIPVVGSDTTFYSNPFCVMKYEAKCDTNNDSIGENNGPNANWDEYAYDAWDNEREPCTGDSRQIVSSAKGWPIGKVALDNNSDHDAISLCEESGWRLMSNLEYMVIARNIEKQSSNWCADNQGNNCGNEPGQGVIIKGHSDYNYFKVYEASVNDEDACFETVERGKNTPCGLEGTEKRTHTLSNGEIIWDFTGNMWELLNDKYTFGEPYNWVWQEFNTIEDVHSNIISMGPEDGSWGSEKGIGNAYYNASFYGTNEKIYSLIRGGGSDGQHHTGIYGIVLDHTMNDTRYPNVGFRCIVDPVS